MKQSHKTLLLWVLLILMFVAIWQFLQPPDRRPNVAFSDFLNEVHAGNVEQITIKDKKFPVTIRVDPAKEPKELDMTPDGGAQKDKVHKAIYKVDKETLTICRGLNPEQDRPREFATWPDTGYFVVKWKKK